MTINPIIQRTANTVKSHTPGAKNRAKQSRAGSIKPHTNGKTQPSVPDIKTMSEQDLATAINGGHRLIESEIHTARKHASAALMGALKTGAYLQEAHRRFKKAGWGSWVRKHCPSLPISTAYRYKDLAVKFPHVRKVEEITTLRQAYIAVGIVPEDTVKKKVQPDLSKAPAFNGTDLVARVKNMREFYDTNLNQFDYGKLEPKVRNQLKVEIKSLLTSLHRLIQRVKALPQEPISPDMITRDKYEGVERIFVDKVNPRQPITLTKTKIGRRK